MKDIVLFVAKKVIPLKIIKIFFIVPDAGVYAAKRALV